MSRYQFQIKNVLQSGTDGVRGARVGAAITHCPHCGERLDAEESPKRIRWYIADDGAPRNISTLPVLNCTEPRRRAVNAPPPHEPLTEVFLLAPDTELSSSGPCLVCDCPMIYPTTTDGTVTWTFWSVGSSNFNFVKERAPDDGTSFLNDQTIGDTELYTINALTGVPTGITSALAVGVDVRGQRDQTTTRAIRTLVNSSGVQADNGSDLTLPNGSYTSFKTIFTTDPNTSAAWTVSGVNAAKIGFKVSV